MPDGEGLKCKIINKNFRDKNKILRNIWGQVSHNRLYVKVLKIIINQIITNNKENNTIWFAQLWSIWTLIFLLEHVLMFNSQNVWFRKGSKRKKIKKWNNYQLFGKKENKLKQK